METDLFGKKINPKTSTPTQRMSTRLSVVPGRDLYTTDPKDIERFLKAAERDGLEILSPIWEPAAGLGDISKTLINHGYIVGSTDIIPYKDSDITVGEADFLTIEKIPLHSGANGISAALEPYKTIFTNPPFNMQEEFLIHALSMGVDVIFFARLSFLSSQRRYRIFERYNPAYVYVYTLRAHCYKDGDVSKNKNMIDYCVIVWKPPYKNETVVRWIP
jgi:hypothetical protein